MPVSKRNCLYGWEAGGGCVGRCTFGAPKRQRFECRSVFPAGGLRGARRQHGHTDCPPAGQVTAGNVSWSVWVWRLSKVRFYPVILCFFVWLFLDLSHVNVWV